MTDRPTGTVTFLFTDIEGSTRLLQRAPEAYPAVLARHHALLREAIAAGGGVEIGTEGDAFFVAFARAGGALTTVVQAQRSLQAEAWPDGLEVRVRMGVHTGQATLSNGDYVGLEVHRAARIAAAAHGGQVLLSDAARALLLDVLPPDISLRSLGEHRLRDIDGPQQLYQLVIAGLPADFPPIKSLTARFDVLPTERTSFVGREDQLVEVMRLLEQTRMLTLTGPGGTGKTRLSLALARRELDNFSDGVAFVELAPISDQRLVASTIRQALSIAEQASASSIQTLISALADRELLLVLDNFEQVIEAASVVDALLNGTTRLKIVVTSRSVLHVTGEQEYPVPPLAIPSTADAADLERVSHSECVMLFVQRARAASPAFAVTAANAGAIVEICRRLDGLPLAIELAASRIKLLPPQALLNKLQHRLDVLQSSSADRTDRQRTLRGAIDWSYDLLADPERAAFRRLGVFVGGWTLEAAEQVVPAARAIEMDTLEAMARLVDNSLVRQLATDDEARFFQLETLREYALERLGEAHEMEVTAGAHAGFFLGMVRDISANFTRDEASLDAAEREHDNIRAALRWAIDMGEIEQGLEACGQLWRFWHLRGHLQEGERWATEALARSPAASHGRTRALNARAGLNYWIGDYAAARRDYEEMLTSARSQGDRASEGDALYSLGYIYGINGAYDDARTAYAHSRDIAKEVGDLLGETNAAFGIVFTDWLDGRFTSARDGVLAVLPAYQALGDRYSYFNAVGVLGRAQLSLGDLDGAAARAREHLDGAVEMGDRTMTSMALHDLASIASLRKDFVRGLQLDGASQALVDRTGGGAPPALVGLERSDEMAAAAGMPQVDIQAALERGAALSLEQAIALARDD